MDKLIQKLAANNFADLAGLNITGDIPVKQEVINDFIAEMLVSGLPSPGAAGGGSAAASDKAPGLDVNLLLKLVKDVKVTADDGKVHLHFVVGVDER